MDVRVQKVALGIMLSAMLVACGSTDTTSQDGVVDQMPTSASSDQVVVATAEIATEVPSSTPIEPTEVVIPATAVIKVTQEEVKEVKRYRKANEINSWAETEQDLIKRDMAIAYLRQRRIESEKIDVKFVSDAADHLSHIHVKDVRTRSQVDWIGSIHRGLSEDTPIARSCFGAGHAWTMNEV